LACWFNNLMLLVADFMMDMAALTRAATIAASMLSAVAAQGEVNCNVKECNPPVHKLTKDEIETNAYEKILKEEQAKGWDCIGQNGPSAGTVRMWKDPKAFAWSWYESDPGCKCDDAKTEIEKKVPQTPQFSQAGGISLLEKNWRYIRYPRREKGQELSWA
jgi:hypothetical protein